MIMTCNLTELTEKDKLHVG